MLTEAWSQPHFLGYSRQGNELTKGKTDNREQLDLGNERPCTWRKGQPEYRRVWGPNQWPRADLAPKFREVFEEYMEELAPLSEEFTGLIAESLGLPGDAFQRFYETPFHSMQHRLKVRCPSLMRLGRRLTRIGRSSSTRPSTSFRKVRTTKASAVSARSLSRSRPPLTHPLSAFRRLAHIPPRTASLPLPSSPPSLTPPPPPLRPPTASRRPPRPASPKPPRRLARRPSHPGDLRRQHRQRFGDGHSGRRNRYDA